MRAWAAGQGPTLNDPVSYVAAELITGASWRGRAVVAG